MAPVLQIKTHVTNTRAVLYLLACNGSFFKEGSPHSSVSSYLQSSTLPQLLEITIPRLKRSKLVR